MENKNKKSESFINYEGKIIGQILTAGAAIGLATALFPIPDKTVEVAQVENYMYCVEVLDNEINVYKTTDIRPSLDKDGKECYIFPIDNNIYVTYIENTKIVYSEEDVNELINKYSDGKYIVNYISEKKKTTGSK